MDDKSYYDGYTDAIKAVDMAMTKSIKENNGAKKAVEILNVFNDVISFLHENNMELTEIKETQYAK